MTTNATFRTAMETVGSGRRKLHRNGYLHRIDTKKYQGIIPDAISTNRNQVDAISNRNLGDFQDVVYGMRMYVQRIDLTISYLLFYINFLGWCSFKSRVFSYQRWVSFKREGNVYWKILLKRKRKQMSDSGTRELFRYSKSNNKFLNYLIELSSRTPSSRCKYSKFVILEIYSSLNFLL